MLEKILHKSNQICFAEDDEDDAYFVKTALNELDPELDVKHFFNGKDLIDFLKVKGEDQPQLVMLDLNMPVLDGRETLRLIRSEISTELPVIILSTSSHPIEKKQCLDIGANSYFTKPYSYQHYLEIMRGLKLNWFDKIQA